jgi:hypothetical protein
MRVPWVGAHQARFFRLGQKRRVNGTDTASQPMLQTRFTPQTEGASPTKQAEVERLLVLAYALALRLAGRCADADIQQLILLVDGCVRRGEGLRRSRRFEQEPGSRE